MANTTYTTGQGDTWDEICKALGQPEAFAYLLQEANPTLLDTVFFSAGTVLALPTWPTVNTTLELPPWKRNQ